jgi:hypothetical protein
MESAAGAGAKTLVGKQGEIIVVIEQVFRSLRDRLVSLLADARRHPYSARGGNWMTGHHETLGIDLAPQCP